MTVGSNSLYRHHTTASAIWFVCAIGLAGLVATALVLMGSAYGGRSMLEDYAVDWSVLGIIRVCGTTAAAAILFLVLDPSVSEERPVDLSGREGRFIGLLAILSVLTLAASAAAVTWFPGPLYDAVDERKSIAVLTEVAFVIALYWLGATAWKARIFGKIAFLGLHPSLIVIGMIIAVFLILMEEMSWGQHWIGWSAGAFFEGNIQDETNLHNFATNKFEAVYYTTAVAVFVVLPHVWPRHPDRLLGSLEFLVPPRAYALAGLPVAGLMYHEWNVVPYQIWFFLGLFIALSAYGALKRQASRQAGPALVLALVLIGAQAVFLINGSALIHGYEVSEIRELVIAMLVAGYACLLHRRVTDAAHAVTKKLTGVVSVSSRRRQVRAFPRA